MSKRLTDSFTFDEEEMQGSCASCRPVATGGCGGFDTPHSQLKLEYWHICNHTREKMKFPVGSCISCMML